MKQIIGDLLLAIDEDNKNGQIAKQKGEFLFKMATQYGFPFELGLEELFSRKEITKSEKLVIFYTYQELMINHQLKGLAQPHLFFYSTALPRQR